VPRATQVRDRASQVKARVSTTMNSRHCRTRGTNINEEDMEFYECMDHNSLGEEDYVIMEQDFQDALEEEAGRSSTS
jgi:hypothetical protein